MEFVTAIAALKVGAMTAPFQTHLGFHLAQLTDRKGPREILFAEAQAEIAAALAQEKRVHAVAGLSAELSHARILRRG